MALFVGPGVALFISKQLLWLSMYVYSQLDSHQIFLILLAGVVLPAFVWLCIGIVSDNLRKKAEIQGREDAAATAKSIIEMAQKKAGILIQALDERQRKLAAKEMAVWQLKADAEAALKYIESTSKLKIAELKGKSKSDKDRAKVSTMEANNEKHSWSLHALINTVPITEKIDAEL